jgi:septal ring factor EnvC (AmiA/AmiB activator)
MALCFRATQNRAEKDKTNVLIAPKTARRCYKMKSLRNVVRAVMVGSLVVAAVGVVGCTKRPNEEELAKLEEARAAAESAERKLAELRRERMDLETQVQDKESELSRHEEERDELQEKMSEHQEQ